MKLLLLLVVGLLVGLARARDTTESLEAVVRAARGCVASPEQPLGACLKRSALALLDEALAAGDTTLVEGVTLVAARPTPGERALNFDHRANESNDLDGQLEDKVAQFFSTRSLQFKIPDFLISDFKQSIREGRKKKKDYLLPFILALKLKAVALVPLVLGAIALLALKALVVGKIALVLSGLIGLQKLLANQHSTKTVEVVAHPTYSHEGHYRRSLDLAYAAHRP